MQEPRVSHITALYLAKLSRFKALLIDCGVANHMRLNNVLKRLKTGLNQMFYLINRTFTKNNSMYEVICEDEGSTPSWSTREI